MKKKKRPAGKQLKASNKKSQCSKTKSDGTWKSSSASSKNTSLKPAESTWTQKASNSPCAFKSSMLVKKPATGFPALNLSMTHKSWICRLKIPSSKKAFSSNFTNNTKSNEKSKMKMPTCETHSTQAERKINHYLKSSNPTRILSQTKRMSSSNSRTRQVRLSIMSALCLQRMKFLGRD